MVATLTAIPWQFFTDTGAVMAAGTINFYTPGTTSAKTLWEDNAKSTEASNPQTLDSSGRWDSGGLFFEGLYDVLVKDSAGNTKFSVLNWHTNWSAVGTDLSENPLSNHSFETAGTGGEPAENWTETDSGTVITRDTADHQHGAASLKFTSSQNGADTILSDAFEVDALMELEVSFDVKSNNATSQPKIEVDWLDNTQSAISSTTLYSSTEGITPTSWTRIYGINTTPPATARYAQVNITGNAHATQYTVAFDNIDIKQYAKFGGESPYSPAGLELSQDADTSHDLNTTIGATKDSTFTEDMVLPTEITKQFDSAWAIGDDAGGDDGSGLPASGVYYIWLIKNLTTSNVDILGSTSASSPTLPTGYASKRLIGAWLTDASNNFIAGTNKGTIFVFHDPLLSIDDSTYTADADETADIDAPPESLAFVRLDTNFGGAGCGDWINFALAHTDTDLSNPASTSDGKEQFVLEVRTGNDIDEFRSEARVLVDTSGQVKYNLDNEDNQDPQYLRIYVWGFDMLTRDYP